MAILVLTIIGSFCVAGGSHHKHIIIHVPYHVKHHHHTHTIYKHIKHIDHGHHDHHDHGHDEHKFVYPGHFELGGRIFFSAESVDYATEFIWTELL